MKLLAYLSVRSGKRSGYRRLLARLLQVAAVLFGAFLIAALYVSYTYDVSLLGAGEFVGRKTALLILEAGLKVYDPCKTRLAELGPGSEETDPPHGALRPEEYFQASEKPSAPCEGHLRTLKIEDETIRRSSFRFYYQPYDEPKLSQLRKKYRLDEVVAETSCEFEQMVRLRSWCRSQFRRKDYQPFTKNFNALEVLDRNLRNDSDRPLDLRYDFDPCKFFPMLYCQVMLSMGYTARFVSIGHGMVEVWSNQHKKWVSMDAELDWHYEKDGIPLNMMEVRDDYFAPQPHRVRIVRGNQSSGDPNTTLVHLKVQELPVEEMLKHHLLDLCIANMRNDWLTNHYFVGHPRQSDADCLMFEDPRLGTERDLWRRLYPRTANRRDMYWTLNQSEIWLRETSSAERLDLVLRTVTPNFDSFGIQIDNATPIHSASGSFTWTLHEGYNSLSVVTVNKFGIRGIPSSLKLTRCSLAPSPTAQSGSSVRKDP